MLKFTFVHILIDVLYLFGESGTGKTTIIYNTLATTSSYYSVICKFGGMTCFFDGYDNQLIHIIYVRWSNITYIYVLTEDLDAVQKFKSMLSTGNTLMEVKFGTIVFDSRLIRLVITSSNVDPQDMANVMGIRSRDPMHRRFTNMEGAHYIVKCHAREKLMHLYVDVVDNIPSRLFWIEFVLILI